MPLAFSPFVPRFLSKAIAALPVPVSATVWGLSAASWLIVTLALRLPVAPGVNFTEIVHDALAARVAGATGQVFVCAKSAAFAPVMPMLLIVKPAVPVFANVAVCAELVVPTWVANVSDDGVRLAAGATPVPLRATVCGLSTASSATETVAVRLPVAPGVKVIEIVQLSLTARVAGASGQVFVCA